MTAMELFALSPSLGGLFGRLVSVSTLLIIPAYLFSAVALSLDPEESRGMRLVAMAAAIACILVAAAANLPDALLALLLVLATAPLFVLNRRPGQARAGSTAPRSSAFDRHSAS